MCSTNFRQPTSTQAVRCKENKLDDSADGPESKCRQEETVVQEQLPKKVAKWFWEPHFPFRIKEVLREGRHSPVLLRTLPIGTDRQQNKATTHVVFRLGLGVCSLALLVSQGIPLHTQERPAKTALQNALLRYVEKSNGESGITPLMKEQLKQETRHPQDQGWLRSINVDEMLVSLKHIQNGKMDCLFVQQTAKEEGAVHKNANKVPCFAATPSSVIQDTLMLFSFFSN